MDYATSKIIPCDCYIDYATVIKIGTISYTFLKENYYENMMLVFAQNLRTD